VGVAAVMRTVFSDLFTFLRVVIPVVKAVLFVRIYVPLLLLAASGCRQSADQNKSYL
jgi:hypothetical protein